MSSTSLVTNGMICYGKTTTVPVPTPVSLHLAEVTTAVEVRPKIRQAATEADPRPTDPVMVSAQDLVPSMSGRAQPEATSPDAPSNISAQELKPKIIKVEEE